MKATQKLHDLGQSLWLDNITRDLLNSDRLRHYIDDLSVTGLTSNPTIFDHAIKNSNLHDLGDNDQRSHGAGDSNEEEGFAHAIEYFILSQGSVRSASSPRTSAVQCAGR